MVWNLLGDARSAKHTTYHVAMVMKVKNAATEPKPLANRLRRIELGAEEYDLPRPAGPVKSKVFAKSCEYNLPQVVRGVDVGQTTGPLPRLPSFSGRSSRTTLTCTGWLRKTANLLLGLDHDCPEDFGRPACGRCEVAYVCYRLLACIYFIGVAIYSGLTEFNGSGKWFIYFSNWTFVLLTLSTLLQVTSVIYHRVVVDRKQRNFGMISSYTSMPLLYKITWLFTNVVLVSATVVTIGFWSYTYYLGGSITPEASPLSLASISKHALDAAHVLINLTISGTPVRKRHVLQPIIFHFAYLIFTVTFWANGGEDYFGRPFIYQEIDYSVQPWESLGLMGLFVLSPIPVFFFFYGVAKLRKYCCLSCGCTYQPRETRKIRAPEVTVPRSWSCNAASARIPYQGGEGTTEC